MKTFKTLAVAAAAWLALGATPAAHAALVLPAGTVITGSASGASDRLLGLDTGFADEAGSHITRLAAADLEYLTADFAVAVDFFSDGRVQVYNNTDTSLLPGNYSLTFDFAGLAQPITSFVALDNSGVTLSVLGNQRVNLSFSNLDFGSPFGSFNAQITTGTVPEPASLALVGAGLGLLALRRTRRPA